MSDLVCPHCHGEVPRGATVCRGCQAEIEYGSPPAAFLVIAIASAFLGFKTSGIVPESLHFLAWVIGIGAFVVGCVLLNKMFGDRVIFKRNYRTR